MIRRLKIIRALKWQNLLRYIFMTTMLPLETRLSEICQLEGNDEACEDHSMEDYGN